MLHVRVILHVLWISIDNILFFVLLVLRKSSYINTCDLLKCFVIFYVIDLGLSNFLIS